MRTNSTYKFAKENKQKGITMKFKKFILVLLLPIFLLVGCKEGTLDSISKNLNTYTIEVTYNDDHTLSCKQTLNFTNRTEDSLDTIKFHLYPRSFREDSSVSVVSKLNYSKCYYNGPSIGDMEILSTAINNESTQYLINGNDNDILSITPNTNIIPNQTVDITIEFTVTLPNINHRFGYGEDTINLGNFYPVLCVYENGEYVIDSYHYNGDPFYSEVANYNVTLTANNNLIVASTGNLSNTSSTENKNTYTYEAKAVRDFSIVLSDKFQVVSDKVDNIAVNYYYYKNQYPQENLKVAVDSIRTFNNLFGTYPYDVINVVESNFVHGGMEYPNLVLISDAVDTQSDYINVIVHELAHQWWYGVVGNNEVEYGWLDEGLTEYSTLLFYEQNPSYGVDTEELIKNTTNSYVTFVDVYTKVFGTADTTMNRALNEYNNESEYVYIAYVKGLLLFDNVREVLGDDKFINCLKVYYQDHAFKIATPDTMIASFEKSSHTELSSLFESWINGKVKIYNIN